MSLVLEAVMLVCFGASWPISLVKNIKAKTAKNISLPFYLLILIGYIAGIGAKFITGTFNYVLAIYILNLLMVLANIFVYFYNYKLDRQEVAELDRRESHGRSIA
jgi:uncharacterized membrane protein (DUF485 family)